MGIGFFSIVAASACGSTTSTTSGVSSGGGSDAAQSASSGAGTSGSSSGGGSHAAASTSSSAGSGGSSSGDDGCHVLMGSGASQTCAWDTSTESGFSCGAETPGSCPSAGLAGCCLAMGASGESADCYYSASSAQTGMDDCDGSGGTWQTTVP